MQTSIALHFQANTAAVRCELDGVVEQLPQDLTDAAYAAQLAFVQWAGNLHAAAGSAASMPPVAASVSTIRFIPDIYAPKHNLCLPNDTTPPAQIGR